MTAITRDHWVSLKAGTIFARVWSSSDNACEGAAVPILLFHDSLGCVELWRDFPRELALATGRPVIAYDRLGFGYSDVRSGPLPLNFIEDEASMAVPFLLEELKLDSVVAFGHSVGGAMAIAMAAHLPERCVAVVAESAQSMVDNRIQSGIRAAQVEFDTASRLERLARYHGAKASWVLKAWIDTWLSSRFSKWSLDDDLPRVRCPLLAIHGDQDEYGTLQHPERITRLAKGPSRMAILPKCGHIPHREQPERVLQEVKQFLEGPDLPSGQ